MRPHRLDRAAWQMISEFERELDRQMGQMRAVLLREFSSPKSTAPRYRSPHNK